MGAIASQITSLTIVYSDADQRKHQSSASLAFVRGIHRGPVNSPHKWPVTRKMFPFDDVIMTLRYAPVAMCNIRYILFEFSIGERCLRLKRLMFSMYSHMFSILLICPHMSYVYCNHWLDAIASTLFLCYLCPNFMSFFIIYVILLYILTCITGPHCKTALLIVLSCINMF